MEKVAVITKTASVVVFKAGGRVFDYLHSNLELWPGAVVTIPFGARQTFGIVIACHDHSDIPLAKMKSILKVFPYPFSLTVNHIQLMQWMSKYYQVSIGRLIAACFPISVLTNESLMRTYVGAYVFNNLPRTKLTKAQRECVEWLQGIKTEVISYEQLLDSAFAKKTIHSMIDHGFLTAFQTNKNREVVLTEEQSCALEKLTNGLSPSLLFGVTGSGKTHIYLAMAKQHLQVKKQVLILVPEIGLTPQTVGRAVSALGVNVSQWHSKLGDSQRRSVWHDVANNDVSVVIGTRSALFLPFQNLGLIIIDEEHDLSFCQQGHPFFSVKDAAIVLAKQNNIPIVLGSATPSMETWLNVEKGKYQCVRLNSRYAKTSKHVHLVDMRKNVLVHGITKPILDRTLAVLKEGKQILFFLNRRGYSPVTLCHMCGWFNTCNHCDVKLNYSKKMNKMRCHLCQTNYPLPSVCADCGSDEIVQVGIGTEKLAEYLKEEFSDFDVIRIDADTMQSPSHWASVRKELNLPGGKVIVGTQMIAKGHDFSGLTDVVVVDTDHALYATDFRALERWGQMIFQVAGRCGRGDQAGNIWIQSHLPHHPALGIIQAGNYQPFMEYLVDQRREGSWPPFSFLAKIRHQASDQFALERKLKDWIRTIKQKIEVIGPILPAITKRQNIYHGYLLLRSNEREPLFQACYHLSEQGAVVEVDPQELDN
ncbi:MAG: primosomal protein N' [Legionellales bacterium]|nr:primosomal protein N' [Legionellales bacterium]OUX64861.1 MAG: primosomal protein N' [Gammaproteobacteria bacterium TMED281]